MSSPHLICFCRPQKAAADFLHLQRSASRTLPACNRVGEAGEEMALTYQFAGASSTASLWEANAVLRLGWRDQRCVQQGAWHTGASHLRPQTCVKRVEFEVAA